MNGLDYFQTKKAFKMAKEGCEVLSNEMQRKFGVGFMCLMIEMPTSKEVDDYFELDEIIPEALADIGIEGTMIDGVSGQAVSFIPLTEEEVAMDFSDSKAEGFEELMGIEAPSHDRYSPEVGIYGSIEPEEKDYEILDYVV